MNTFAHRDARKKNRKTSEALEITRNLSGKRRDLGPETQGRGLTWDAAAPIIKGTVPPEGVEFIMFPPSTRVLVVDDMVTMREMVKTQLRALGMTHTVEADNGENALRELINQSLNGQPIELIISDWNMPRMTGLEFLKQVRAAEDYEQLPFLLVTAESEREQVADAILAGVSQYLVKPFSPKSFADKLKSVWDKEQAKRP